MGAFSVITNLRMDIFEALMNIPFFTKHVLRPTVCVLQRLESPQQVAGCSGYSGPVVNVFNTVTTNNLSRWSVAAVSSVVSILLLQTRAAGLAELLPLLQPDQDRASLHRGRLLPAHGPPLPRCRPPRHLSG